MNASERIKKIEEFVHAQSYIRGVLFRVDIDTEYDDEDHFVITFGKINKRQFSTVQHRLRAAEIFHIRCRYQELTETDQPRRKQKRH